MAASPSPRVLAIRILRDVEREQAFSNRTLSRHLERHPDMDPRDRGFVTTLVYGVLRQRARLDRHIDAHASKASGLKGEVRELLRVAAFELRELGRPAPIAIAEAIKVARRLDAGARLAGVVQAIASAIDREGASLDAALEAAPPLDRLEFRWSIPRWLGGRWLKTLGPDKALARARCLAEPPPLDLRVDLHRTTRDAVAERLRSEHPGIELELPEGEPQAIRARGGGDLFYGPLHGEGLVSIQGLGAQQPARVLDARPGERVLDGCAGMGVKTLQLAELMQRRGTIVAADVDARPLREHDELHVRGDLQRPDLHVSFVQADLTGDAPELDAEPFDAVLLDVPCTGLGNLARHPEIRWLRRFEDIAARAELQRALLRRNLARVRPGGRLVYAACTFEPDEGPKVVGDIAAEGGLEIEVERTYTPEDDATEGFYVARLRRA